MACKFIALVKKGKKKAKLSYKVNGKRRTKLLTFGKQKDGKKRKYTKKGRRKRMKKIRKYRKSKKH